MPYVTRRSRLRLPALLAGLVLLVLTAAAGPPALRLPPVQGAALAEVQPPEARAILHTPMVTAALPDTQALPPDAGAGPGLLPAEGAPAPRTARAPMRGYPAALAPPSAGPRRAHAPRAPPFA